MTILLRWKLKKLYNREKGVFVMNIYDYQSGTSFVRLYRSKFKCEEDFEDLLKFLDLPIDCGLIDIEVEAAKVVINGKIHYDRSYSGK